MLNNSDYSKPKHNCCVHFVWNNVVNVFAVVWDNGVDLFDNGINLVLQSVVLYLC